jgi:hypothetical protein
LGFNNGFYALMRLRLLKLIGALALVSLAACGDDNSDYSGLAPASGPTVTTSPEPPFSTNIMNALTPSWSTRGDANSVTLALVHLGTTPPTPVLTMTCARGAVLSIEAPLLVPDPSASQLQIGAGDTVVGLPLVGTPDASGVTAQGPAFRDLLAEITVGRLIRLSYGQQTLGPLPPAPNPMTSRFVNRCRSYLEPSAY